MIYQISAEWEQTGRTKTVCVSEHLDTIIRVWNSFGDHSKGDYGILYVWKDGEILEDIWYLPNHGLTLSHITKAV